jgi:D-3-phosphoglycerate dehydrogenase / 2-oxoglutarate reductase
VSRFNVVVTDDRFGSYTQEEEVLAEAGARLVVLNLSEEEEAAEALQEADGILVNLFPMTGRLISGLTRCRVISRYGVGYDNVDVEAATRQGIWVTRVPDYATEDVGDHALALLMACVRGVVSRDGGVRAGGWNLYGGRRVRRVSGKTLGIIGYGRTGRCFHRKTSGLGLGRVLICDPHVDAPRAALVGAEAADLRTLLCQSDYVSIHVPLNQRTRGLIGRGELELMRPTAIVLNTSRGAVVDEGALAEALAVGRLAGAGLDVFEREPLPPDSPLIGLGSVVLSDHAAWYSEESVVELKTKAARNVAAVLCGRVPAYALNMPFAEEASHAALRHLRGDNAPVEAAGSRAPLPEPVP